MLRQIIRSIIKERHEYERQKVRPFQLASDSSPSPIDSVADWAQAHAKPGSSVSNIISQAWKAMGKPDWGNAARNLMIQRLESLGFKY